MMIRISGPWREGDSVYPHAIMDKNGAVVCYAWKEYASLLAAAPDYALLLSALTSEICSVVYAPGNKKFLKIDGDFWPFTVDEFACPVVTDAIRRVLKKPPLWMTL
jgi:hypothetical protein